MTQEIKNPCILIVTPEVTYLPKGMATIASFFRIKAGGLADVSAALISSLFEQGANVHIAVPDYRAMFNDRMTPLLKEELRIIRSRMPGERVHLAEDRAFYYQNSVYANSGSENLKIALAFQREVINNIVPQVQPDLIHCNDWMTGLIPAMARELGIPSLFTIHNIHTYKVLLDQIDDRGIDSAAFWRNLFFDRPPLNYEESRHTNPIDFLLSGVFSAHYVNTVSPTFLKEMIDGWHSFVEPTLKSELFHKWNAGCAVGILNAPDPSFNPSTDPYLAFRYDEYNHFIVKRENKRFFQKKLGLIENPNAPIFFWPSRLDNIQKGCQLLAEILFHVVSRYWNEQLQIVFVANGEYQNYFKDIVNHHQLHQRVAVCNFDDGLERMAYSASDFMLMPSRFEPCGLPQMIAPIYGSLPVAHDTGGIHDTVSHMDVANNRGNGFLFQYFNSEGLSWAIDQAMQFYFLPTETKRVQIGRVMKESKAIFAQSVTASKYIDLYERMLRRPLVNGNK
ncbi:MAG: glycogen/starch synthase [Desulfobacterales bacterium]|nr:glycogen/starch synthase [Desulfobacterales bacterium]